MMLIRIVLYEHDLKQLLQSGRRGWVDSWFTLKILLVAVKQQRGNKTNVTTYLFHLLRQQQTGVLSVMSTSWKPLCVSVCVYSKSDCLWPWQTGEELTQTRWIIILFLILSRSTHTNFIPPLSFSWSLCCHSPRTLSVLLLLPICRSLSPPSSLGSVGEDGSLCVCQQ